MKEQLLNLKNAMKEGKSRKSVEDLIKEGWKNTYILYADMEIYKKDNERILYDNKNQKIYIKYFIN